MAYSYFYGVRIVQQELSAKQWNNRIPYWDNIKGFLIILVVLAHFLYEHQSNSVIHIIVSAIYMFHMPAFVFISGYMSKSNRSRSKDSLLRLGFAYLFFNSIFLIIFSITKNTALATYPFYSYWYLLALIVWRFAANYLAKVKRILLILFALALLAGFWIDIDNSFSLARIISFSPFFMAGYLIKTETIEALFIKKNTMTLLRGIATALLATLLGFVLYFILGMQERTYTMLSYVDGTDFLSRIVLFIVACAMIFVILTFTINKQLPILTQIGRNSLPIFVLHRFLALIYSQYFPNLSAELTLISSIALTWMTVMIFGSETAAKWMSQFLDFPLRLFSKTDKISIGFRVTRILCIALAFLVFCAPILANPLAFLSPFIPNTASIDVNESASSDADQVHPKLSAEEEEKLKNAYKIVFAGDLILLEDQVKRAYNGESYDFSPLFEFTSPYLSSADLAIGVFEGPMAGPEAGYSTSNYDDGKEVRLNFPDSFAEAVREAGFDLVTNANNHILDQGDSGAVRTLDVLDQIGLDHTGSYRSQEEKDQNRVKLIEKDGLKFAVLSYTFGSNSIADNDLIDGEYSYLTSVLVDPGSERYEEVKRSVSLDFELAKTYSPDFILVLPHMGTQFSDQPDDFQLAWCDYFRELGADIILGDHTHSVQPVRITREGSKTVFTAFSPGNYSNIYRDYNGDASALIEIYIDKTSKSIIGGGVVPMWTYSTVKGNYRPVPIFDIVNNDVLSDTLSTDDMNRVEEVNSHITNTMLGVNLDLHMIRERYYFNQNGFVRSSASPLPLTPALESSTLFREMSSAKSICFLGDSITEGTRNGGYPWYEPLESYFPGSCTNISFGGGTVKTLLDNITEIQTVKADLYVIAIGTNDVRYRDESICAMTSEAYIEKIQQLCDGIKKSQPSARFAFVAPWTSTDGDPFSPISYSQKIALNDEYSDSLKLFCQDQGYLFSDPNNQIESILDLYPRSDYLIDHIHPDSADGISLYSSAVLLGCMGESDQ